jgi:putative membrane protein
MIGFLVRWFVTAVSVLAASKLVGGIVCADYGSLAVAALLLGIVNAFVRPILLWLTLPISVLTLGVFALVVNGALFWLVGRLVKGFYVVDFWSGFWGAIVVAVISFIVNGLIGSGGGRVHIDLTTRR